MALSLQLLIHNRDFSPARGSFQTRRARSSAAEAGQCGQTMDAVAYQIDAAGDLAARSDHASTHLRVLSYSWPPTSTPSAHKPVTPKLEG